ncbi:MaoC/PaaZ C-terminal domain-containing protein [Streptomyces sioyaensis]|uniref:MaoC/PaaZ C-terminal domain-containing protein n=1 Tax=Streptomyces sioyaensis TaxID=67364 RepID=UPI0037A19895
MGIPRTFSWRDSSPLVADKRPASGGGQPAQPPRQLRVHAEELPTRWDPEIVFDALFRGTEHAFSAQQAGFPSALAHGMLTMALAGQLVTGWSGDPAALCDVAVRFTRPVPVPDDGVGARLDIRGTVTAKLDGRRVRVALDVRCDDVKVLGSAQAVVQLN